jgi:hypothetical protein
MLTTQEFPELAPATLADQLPSPQGPAGGPPDRVLCPLCESRKLAPLALCSGVTSLEHWLDLNA